MGPRILDGSTVEESFTQERCFISEVWNSPEDEHLSIARARIVPGVATTRHYLEGVVERYLVTAGTGRVEIGNLPSTEVKVGDVVVIPAGTSQRIENMGKTDLVFYCICTPRFDPDCYHDVETG